MIRKLGIVLAVGLGLIAPALAQAPEASAPAAGNSSAVIWTLAIGAIVNALVVWLKNLHDARVKRDEATAAAAKEQQRIDADAKTEERRLAAETEKETRHRQWQLEDRDRLAREVERTGRVLAARVEQASTDLAKTAAASHDVVLGAIKENTQISRDAFDVNNHVKEKFAHTEIQIDRLAARLLTEQLDTAQAAGIANDRLARLEKEPPLPPEVLDRVDETTQETLAATQETLKEVKKQGDA